MQGDEIESGICLQIYSAVRMEDDARARGYLREALTAAEARGYERGYAEGQKQRGGFKRGYSQALEEAARVAGDFESDIGDLYVERIAAAIRNLKP